ncbi:MAG TPA: winged helix-turn-helix domain-containing protein [Candidatus Acidoferrales bacterium]|nr:winged helix-turn-helix domain-containing protein [Candidatus Acidoferrales bacterium]
MKPADSNNGETRCERPRRGRQDIIMEILRQAKKGKTRYSIMNKVGMSSKQTEEYTKYLLSAGYLTETSGFFKTSQKGQEVICTCEVCHNLMKIK